MPLQYDLRYRYSIHISSLERIQRKFLETVVFITDGIYPSRGFSQELLLKRFEMSSLLKRRLELSVILLFKILRGKQDCPTILQNINKTNVRKKTRFICPPDEW